LFTEFKYSPFNWHEQCLVTQRKKGLLAASRADGIHAQAYFIVGTLLTLRVLRAAKAASKAGIASAKSPSHSSFKACDSEAF